MGTAKRERQKSNRQERLRELQRHQARRQTRRKGVVIAVFVLAVLAAGLVIALTTGGDDDEVATSATSVGSPDTTVGPADTTPATLVPSATDGATLTGPTPCPAADGSSPRTVVFAEPPPTCIDPTKAYTAAVETNKGSFTMSLDPAAAPVAVNNFVVLARYHYYDGTSCHRIIPAFVVQCVDPSGGGDQGSYPGYRIAEEPPADASAYQPGVVAMAKTQEPASTGGQFFVVLESGPPAADYSVLGRVTEGFDTTVKAMEAAADPAAANGVPKELVTITKVTITET